MKSVTQQGVIILENATQEFQFRQIVALQQKNHLSSMTLEDQSRNGFVYARHTVEMLKAMSAILPQVIAVSGGEVIGYTLAMDETMKNYLSDLEPMFTAFDQCNYRGMPLKTYRYMVGGQVCIDEKFRGQGLISVLYRRTRELVSDRYQLCVTEISSRNLVSLRAHQKIGFEVIHEYSDGDENWKIVAWEFAAIPVMPEQ